MARFTKPPEGSWTEHYPELGTGPVSYEDSISPEFYELEREAIFKRSWLNVGRVEQLSRNGSYFTKDLAVANTSIVIVRDMDGEVRAFHNICRHRGNKLVWNDNPREETSGSCRQFVCKYHGWKYDLDGACVFAQQESEFFDFDKADYGLVSVHCDVWAGFIFVNLEPEPSQTLHRLPRSDDHVARGLPVRPADAALLLPRRSRQQLEAVHGRVPGVLSRTGFALAPPSGGDGAGVDGSRVRSAVLRDRRSAPRRQHVGHTRVGDARQHDRSDVPRVAQWAVRSVGRAGPRARCRRASTRARCDPWGLDSFQIWPNFVILIWERGWYLTYHYWPTSQNTHMFEGTLYFVPPKNARERVAQEVAAVTFKEYALQDGNTLEATQIMLESRVVDGVPAQRPGGPVPAPAQGGQRLGRRLPARTAEV